LKIVLSVFIACLLSCRDIRAAEIIVNPSAPQVDYTLDDVRAIFTSKRGQWPNGKPIRVFTLSDSHPTHKAFVKTVLFLLPHQLRRIWDRNTFSGTGSAPTEVSSEQEMLEKIATTPNSIGYLNSVPSNEKIRLLKVQ
jgi:ABC-type phosphate transport system substrate-binding protein